MHRLEWDDTLAAESQAYAEQCVFAHDTVRNRANGWGENLAMLTSTINGELQMGYSTDTLVNMVQEWYDEWVDADWTESGPVAKVYGSPADECQAPDDFDDPNDVKCQIGHYTQVVWASTTHVGCAWQWQW